MKAKSGFTLVEILIVVVILGILAAIVIPQFTEASSEATENSTRADLQTVRSQIQLYRVQHLDELPGAGGATFIEAMEGETELDGDVWAAGADFGPYLERMPTNPYGTTLTDEVDVDGTLGDGSHGWHFDSTTGAFHADTTTQPDPNESSW